MHTLTGVAEIKNRLSKHDVESLCRSEENPWKIQEILKLIYARQLDGKPIWIRELMKSDGLKGVGNRYMIAAVWWLVERGYVAEEKRGRKKMLTLTKEGRDAYMKLDEVLNAPKPVLKMSLDLGDKPSEVEVEIKDKGLSDREKLEILTKPHIVDRLMELSAGIAKPARHHTDLSLSVRLKGHVGCVIPEFATVLWGFYLKVIRGPVFLTPRITDPLDPDMHTVDLWDLHKYDEYWKRRLEVAVEWLNVRKEVEGMFKLVPVSSKLEEEGKKIVWGKLEPAWEEAWRRYRELLFKLREVAPLLPVLDQQFSETLQQVGGERIKAFYFPNLLDILDLGEEIITVLRDEGVRRWVDRRLDEAHKCEQDFFMPMLFWVMLGFKPRRTDLESFRDITPPTFTSITHPRHIEAVQKLLNVFDYVLAYIDCLHAETKLPKENKLRLKAVKDTFSRAATRNWPDGELDKERVVYAFLWDRLGSMQDDPALYEGWRLIRGDYRERLDVSRIMDVALERYVFAGHKLDVDLAAAFADLARGKNPSEVEEAVRSGLYKLKAE